MTLPVLPSRPSPIRLVTHALTRLEVSELPEGGSTEVTVEPFLEIRKNPDSPRQWLLRLCVEFRGDKGYSGAAAFEGIFEADETIPEDKVSRLTVVNGASILYGAAREIVATVTSRGRFEPLVLPSLSFAGVDVVESRTPEPDS